ncbi:MAG: hypothetical protein WBW94_03780 [Anaerolineales bacterium]
MTLFPLLFSIMFGFGSLAFGYHLAGLTQFARWIIFFGAVWLIAVWQRWRWFAYIGIVFDLLFAALGLWLLNFPPGWMFAGAIGGLLAFDLTFFWERVRFIDSDEERRGFESRHLLRISVLAILGMTAASITMLIKLQFTFQWAILLLLIILLGITQLIIWLLRRN